MVGGEDKEFVSVVGVGGSMVVVVGVGIKG